jgi:hypothetical protein
VTLRARFAAKTRREICLTPRVNEFGVHWQWCMIALFSFFVGHKRRFRPGLESRPQISQMTQI